MSHLDRTERLAYLAAGFLLHRYLYRPLKALLLVSILVGGVIGGLATGYLLSDIKISIINQKGKQ